MEAAEISFKISFLRTLVASMTEPDLDTFQNVCEHFRTGDAKLADLELLNQLFAKFDKPVGNERI